ncbi:ArsR/SmtB family transcription factor [Ideonella sp. BN130291]|uniref:ArsR/SmtB family transcription factor n=1 Tax=Ideonella sp. BN130291 TaxID=3112940 RepID=UPI002E25DBFD|nr:helix-turn-helix domain-containing protein [Ideonella sp. BN130291]
MSRPSGAALAQARSAAPLFAALGDQTRLQLLLQLSRLGPGSIASLSADAVVSRQAVTKHLRILADAGYVQGERVGREHLWRLKPERLQDAQAWLERISAEWDEALGRLKHFVEG